MSGQAEPYLAAQKSNPTITPLVCDRSLPVFAALPHPGRFALCSYFYNSRARAV
jgi:hypothetical protein